jgi:hypothetical protein
MKRFHRIFLLAFTAVLTACVYTYSYEPEKQDGFYIDSDSSSRNPTFYRLSDRRLIFQIAEDQARGSVLLYARQNGEVPPNVLIDESCPADAGGNCQRVRQTNTLLEVICSTAKLVHNGKTYEAIAASPPPQSNTQASEQIEECSSKANLDGKQLTGLVIRFETWAALNDQFSIILPSVGGAEMVTSGTVNFTKKVTNKGINFSIR